MTTDISSILLTEMRKKDGFLTCIRLIKTFDVFQMSDIFSIFLTTQAGEIRTEDFVYDVARNFETAKRLFDILCENGASAVHLHELAEDFLSALEA